MGQYVSLHDPVELFHPVLSLVASGELGRDSWLDLGQFFFLSFVSSVFGLFLRSFCSCVREICYVPVAVDSQALDNPTIDVFLVDQIADASRCTFPQENLAVEDGVGLDNSIGVPVGRPVVEPNRGPSWSWVLVKLGELAV